MVQSGEWLQGHKSYKVLTSKQLFFFIKQFLKHWNICLLCCGGTGNRRRLKLGKWWALWITGVRWTLNGSAVTSARRKPEGVRSLPTQCYSDGNNSEQSMWWIFVGVKLIILLCHSCAMQDSPKRTSALNFTWCVRSCIKICEIIKAYE